MNEINNMIDIINAIKEVNGVPDDIKEIMEYTSGLYEVVQASLGKDGQEDGEAGLAKLMELFVPRSLLGQNDKAGELEKMRKYYNATVGQFALDLTEAVVDLHNKMANPEF